MKGDRELRASDRARVTRVAGKVPPESGFLQPFADGKLGENVITLWLLIVLGFCYN